MLLKWEYDEDGYYTLAFRLELGVDSPVLNGSSVLVPYSGTADADVPWIVNGSINVHVGPANVYGQGNGPGQVQLQFEANGLRLTNRTVYDWGFDETISVTIPFSIASRQVPPGQPGQIVTYDENGNAIAADPEPALPDGGLPGQFPTPDGDGGFTWQYPPVEMDEVPDGGPDGAVLVRDATQDTGTKWDSEIGPQANAAFAEIYRNSVRGVLADISDGGDLVINGIATSFSAGDNTPIIRNALKNLALGLTANNMPSFYVERGSAWAIQAKEDGLVYDTADSNPEVLNSLQIAPTVSIEARLLNVSGIATSAQYAANKANSQFNLLGYEIIYDNTTFDLQTFLAAYAPGTNLDDLRLEIEVIGGGGAGARRSTTTASLPGSGGAPGGVTFVRDPVGNTMIHPIYLSDLISVVIGAGGPGAGLDGANTVFGNWIGYGGRGGRIFTGSTFSSLSGIDVPISDVPLGRAGIYESFAAIDANPSAGPSGGGAGGGKNQSNLAASRAGTSGSRSYETLKLSEAAGNTDRDMQSAYDYAVGGDGGAGGLAAAAAGDGKPGGFGGGGGGGGGANTSTGTADGFGGSGGPGAVRIRLFKREGA